MIGWVAGLLVSTGAMGAGSPQVPPALQAALFRKVIAYDETITSSGNADKTRILVVSAGNSAAVSDLLAAFRALGVQGEEVQANAIESVSLALSVVYVMPGAYSPRLRELCQQQRVLTVSGDPELARQGAVAVALYLDQTGRPKILINAERLEGNGHKLQPSLLALAEIIR